MVAARQLHPFRAWDMGREEAPPIRRDPTITQSMKYQRRHPDGRKSIADIDLPVHLHERDRGRRAGTLAFPAREFTKVNFVVGLSRGESPPVLAGAPGTLDQFDSAPDA